MLEEIISNTKLFFKQLFCSHKYSAVGEIDSFYYYSNAKTEKRDRSITFFECTKCGKRKVLRANEYAYPESVFEAIKMWEKHEIEITFNKRKSKS